MKQLTIKGVLEVLNLMAECEHLMAELYRTASRVWKEEQDFWEQTAGQEDKHAEYVLKMIDLISINPEDYRPGRPLTLEAAGEFAARIREVTADLKRHAVSRHSFIKTVSDFEQKVIESNYSQIVITDNTVYKQLVKMIVADTAGHKSAIESLKKS